MKKVQIQVLSNIFIVSMTLTIGLPAAGQDVEATDNLTDDKCKSLLCGSNPSSRDPCGSGRYLAADCSCTSCPVSPAPDTPEWKFACLTKVLGSCPVALASKPTPRCMGLCSDVSTQCAQNDRFPDSACVCVPCSTAGADDAQLLWCARKRGFCVATTAQATTTSVDYDADPTPSGECTEQQLMECRNCSASRRRHHHHPNGSCRACPHRRDADWGAAAGDCELHQPALPPGHVALAVIGALLGAALLSVIGWRIYPILCRKTASQSGGTSQCTLCGKPVQSPCLPADGDYCRCRIYGIAAANQEESHRPLMVRRSSGSTSNGAGDNGTAPVALQENGAAAHLTDSAV